MTTNLFNSQLRRIDEEIQQHRQEIAYARVRIAELEEARLTIQRLADHDLALAGRANPDIEVLVRREQPQQLGHLAGNEEGEASRLAKYGDPAAHKEQRDHKAYMKRKAKKRFSPMDPNGWSAKILTYLKGVDEPVTLAQLANFHGVRDVEERRRLRTALGRLKSQGLIGNPSGQPQGTGHKASYLITGRASAANGAAAHP